MITLKTDPFIVPRISHPFEVEIALPGSKSIALRQLAIAALTEGETTITGIPECDDTEAMLESVARLGVKIDKQANAIILTGPMDLQQDIELDARMSGASTRLLIALAALRHGKTHIDGHESLRKRTNAPLFDVLRKHNCAVEATGNGLPVTIQGPFVAQNQIRVDGSLSSQYLTALMIVAPYVEGSLNDSTAIEIISQLVSRPYIDITVNEMRKRGVSPHWIDDHNLTIPTVRYSPGKVAVEGDATAASYFLALATVHASVVTLTNLGASTCQGDYRFTDVMASLGADVKATPTRTTLRGPTHLEPLIELNMQSMPDAALTLIAMAPLLPDGAIINGLSTLHHKECDRLLCPVHEFKQMGVRATATEDRIEIEPNYSIGPHTLRTYHDHRMAMAFSVLGSTTGTLAIDDPAVVGKTYPDYWDDYARLL
jgi:3-phosphoshikimate 1-carboxyvinyltransferase